MSNILGAGFPGGSDSKESACSAGDLGLIPELGLAPREGNSYSLQHFGLDKSMDRGAWWATDHGVAKTQIQLSNFEFSLDIDHYSLNLLRLKDTG